ncbi:MAG: hypothetical protein AMXMBFR16_10040 [Candidatus Uhrbacteria bacterium]
MPRVVNVTIEKGNTDWTGYVVLNGCAVRVARGCLADLRYYAEREGYDGILIGGPSVPFARIRVDD